MNNCQINIMKSGINLKNLNNIKKGFDSEPVKLKII